MDPCSRTYKSFALGKLVLSSGLVRDSWSKISELEKSRTKSNQIVATEAFTEPEDEFTFLVFNILPSCKIDSLSSDFTKLTNSQKHNPFWFLCSETISSFSVHSSAYKLFKSVYNVLPQIKSKIVNAKKPLIITGSGLGGSVASLFTLWLLDTIKPDQELPMCITFGSPLIGDTSLQQILDNSVRNSCFLHVVLIQDSVTKHLFKQPNTNNNVFKPFGTFLICFETECICIDDPESIEELLVDVNRDKVSMEWKEYNEFLQRLEELAAKAHLRGSRPQEEKTEKLIYDVIVRMEDRASKKLRFDPLKKLNDMKIIMAHLEWYKKESRKDKIGYYDRFKNQMSSPASSTDMKVIQFKEEMNDYWKSVVEEVQKKPQSETAILRKRSLLSANIYRRMVEPLNIAEYYLNGNRNYRTLGRSNHYIMLEKWFKDSPLPVKSIKSAERDLNDLLMIDSCFWAEVEESIIAIKLLKTAGSEGVERDVLIGKLVKFEKYVQDLIGKFEISPEIFLEKSSFMIWWKEYKEFKGNEYTSYFFDFMERKRYKSYGQTSK